MKKSELYSLFKTPDNSFRGMPFWAWNGELEKDELLRQVEVMKEMGFGGFFMHSRSGLITEYLGKEWFELINACADKAEEMGLEAWLYDEDRWPSGSCGGMAAEEEKYRMKSLRIKESDIDDYHFEEGTFLAFEAHIDGNTVLSYAPLNLNEKPKRENGENKVLSFNVVTDEPDNNYNEKTYIDTMSCEAVQNFINLTHEKYKTYCGDRFSKSIKGIFTDEPHRGQALNRLFKTSDNALICDTAYTNDLFDEFKLRYGYDLKEKLPELFYKLENEALSKVKVDYFDLCTNLFNERFMIPINEWCEKNGIVLTGHVLHEDSLSAQTAPHGSVMRSYEHMGAPGVDVLTEHNYCFFVAKQLQSAARQLGKKRLLSELYGCTGWEFNLRSHKHVGDWQALFGINFRCPHLSWYTMEGEAKRDYPASILHQSTYYHDYSAVETYFSRFGVLNTVTSPCCDLLVLSPIESFWGHTFLGWNVWVETATDPILADIEKKYEDTFNFLISNHIDFDYGEEYMIRNISKVIVDKDGSPVLKVGNSEYRTVLVTNMHTVRRSTLDILEEFAKAGGEVVFAGDVPEYVDSLPSNQVQELAKMSKQIPFTFESFGKNLRKNITNDVFVTLADNTPCKQVYVQLRKTEDSFVALCLNVDRNNEYKNLKLKLSNINCKNTELWDMFTGERKDISHLVYTEGSDICLDVDFMAGESKAIVFSNGVDKSVEKTLKTSVVCEKEFPNEFEYTLDEENVLVLDYAKATLGSMEFERSEILKIDDAIRNYVGIETRSGGMLQPWYAKTKYTDVLGNLTLTYDFNCETDIVGDLFLAAERPENFKISVNGKEVYHNPADGFYIDSCFKKLRVPVNFIKKGKNTVTVEGDFKQTSNIESLYLIGNFGVKYSGNSSVITTLPEKLTTDTITEQGLAFYTGVIKYHVDFQTLKNITKTCKGEKVFLVCDDFKGALVKITSVNHETKYITWEPYSADITDIVNSSSSFNIEFVPTRRNTFGPLHCLPVVQGAYGPFSFKTDGESFTDDYALIETKLGKVKIRCLKGENSI